MKQMLVISSDKNHLLPTKVVPPRCNTSLISQGVYKCLFFLYLPRFSNTFGFYCSFNKYCDQLLYLQEINAAHLHQHRVFSFPFFSLSSYPICVVYTTQSAGQLISSVICLINFTLNINFLFARGRSLVDYPADQASLYRLNEFSQFVPKTNHLCLQEVGH